MKKILTALVVIFCLFGSIVAEGRKTSVVQTLTLNIRSVKIDRNQFEQALHGMLELTNTSNIAGGHVECNDGRTVYTIVLNDCTYQDVVMYRPATGLITLVRRYQQASDPAKTEAYNWNEPAATRARVVVEAVVTYYQENFKGCVVPDDKPGK